jgi:hypothetical protein
MKKILELIKKLFGKKELVGKAVEVAPAPAPVVELKPAAPKKKPAKKKKKNESK